MDIAAKVVTVNGVQMAEWRRTEACGSCSACGKRSPRYLKLPDGTYHDGEEIVLSLPDHGALRASLMGYGIPLGAMMLGLIVGAVLGIPEGWQVILILIMLGVGYGVLKALEPRLRRSGAFEMRCRR